MPKVMADLLFTITVPTGSDELIKALCALS